MSADIGGTLRRLPVDETGIAWGSDIKDKFGSQTAENFNTQEDAAQRGGGTITGERSTHLYTRVVLTTAPAPGLHVDSHVQPLARSSIIMRAHVLCHVSAAGDGQQLFCNYQWQAQSSWKEASPKLTDGKVNLCAMCFVTFLLHPCSLLAVASAV